MIIVIKRGIVYLCLGLIIIVIALLISNTTAPAADFKHENYRCIILDPGHGIPDGGAVSENNTTENTLNLQISQKVRAGLLKRGYNVIMTRDDLNGLDKNKRSDMNMRLNIMKNTDADMFVSIHINKFSKPQYRGAEVLYSANFTQSTLLAQMIIDNIKKVDPTNQTRNIKEAEKSLFLMKNATLPAVIVECGFLSNPEEEKLLKSSDYQQKIADAICSGIVDYYKNIDDYEKFNSVNSEA